MPGGKNPSVSHHRVCNYVALHCSKLVTVHLHPIFVRFALLWYREYTSEGETNKSGAHLNGYSYELRVVYCLW
ncbi:hypothetical protein BMS3Bbin14_01243 [bacterium BMS3Bbin14]|nr:hypothetical protein BMS3Bbin14_01243 [bacterium BMS3Bbin14]